MKDFNIANAQEHFNTRVRQPFLDCLLQNIADRFPSLQLIGAFDILIPPLSNENEERLKSKSKENLNVILAHYGDSLVDGGEIYKEWESFSVLHKEHYTGAKEREYLKIWHQKYWAWCIHNYM